MTEAYQASRDALIEVVGAALGDKTQRPLPWYARSDVRQQGLTGAALERALAGWALVHPDRVEREN